MVLSSFSIIKNLGRRYILLLRTRANSLMFQHLDLSPIFSFFLFTTILKTNLSSLSISGVLMFPLELNRLTE